MEFYNVFIKVLLKEISKFKLDTEIYSSQIAQLTAALDENFDIPYNRCAFMYRYATAFTFFFNDCTKKFFSSYSHTSELLSKWKSCSEVKVCSLSVGPGLDYLGFVLAVLEHDSAPSNFDINVVTKYGAWRNTANLMLEVFGQQDSLCKVSCPKLKYQNVKVIQADLLKSYSRSTHVIAVREANIILMMKTLNLLAAGSAQEGILLHMFKEIVSSLNSGTIIFCIDTKPSIAVITQALSHFSGKFLHGPIHQTVQLPAVFPEINGSHPIISIRGAFFVWQKTESSLINAGNSPLKNIGMENKVGDLSTICNSGDSSAESMTKLENNDTENILNLPWMELKSFWQCSSPKTKELLKRVMVTDEESLEEINDLISQSQKLDLNKKKALKSTTTLVKEDINLEGSKIISQSKQDLITDNQKTLFNKCSDFHHDSSESPSPDSLNSVSSFSCDGIDIDALPEWNDIIFNKNNSKEADIKKAITPKENLEKCSSKITQTDTLLDHCHTSDPSSVKTLTDRIRQLAISLENVPQQNDPLNCSRGDIFNHHNDNISTDKPSCSKQPPNFSFQGQGSLPSYQSDRHANCGNTGCHYSCQFSHNRCMHCCFQPCCAQPTPRCGFPGNQHQSRENNFGNVMSANIVIPLQNISDDALLQIISILRSESKK